VKYIGQAEKNKKIDEPYNKIEINVIFCGIFGVHFEELHVNFRKDYGGIEGRVNKTNNPKTNLKGMICIELLDMKTT
jgi:hypothetical protein